MQAQFAGFDLAAGQYLAQESIEHRHIVAHHVSRNSLAVQRRALQAEQTAAGQIGQTDRAVSPDTEVGHRRKLIQIDETLTGFGSRQRRLQGLVLHFQLDLMHLQLMQQTLYLIARLLVTTRGVLTFQPLLGLIAQSIS